MAMVLKPDTPLQAHSGPAQSASASSHAAASPHASWWGAVLQTLTHPPKAKGLFSSSRRTPSVTLAPPARQEGVRERLPWPSRTRFAAAQRWLWASLVSWLVWSACPAPSTADDQCAQRECGHRLATAGGLPQKGSQICTVSLVMGALRHRFRCYHHTSHRVSRLLL
jgi:hypothetical protein